MLQQAHILRGQILQGLTDQAPGGAPLARLEGRVVLQTIVERQPDLALRTAQPAWVPFLRVRRLAELEVELGAPAAPEPVAAQPTAAAPTTAAAPPVSC